MSRKAVITFLAVYLAVVLAISVLWALATPGIAEVRREVIVGGIIGRAVGALVLSGIIPLIYWAIRRSRADASGVLAVWAILGAVIFVLSAAGDMYDGTLQPTLMTTNVAAMFKKPPTTINNLSSNDRNDFVRLAKSSCVEAQQNSPVNRKMGVTSEQMDAYCDCYSNGGVHVMTTDDLSYLMKNGRASPSAQEKIDRLIRGCVRTVFGR